MALLSDLGSWFNDTFKSKQLNQTNQINPQTTSFIDRVKQVIVPAAQTYLNTYQKVAPFIPLAPQVNTPQQVQQNYQNAGNVLNRIKPTQPSKSISQNIVSAPYNIVSGLFNQQVYNPQAQKEKQWFGASPILQLPDQNKMIELAKKRDIKGISKAWEPVEQSTVVGLMGGGETKSAGNKLILDDIKEIGNIARRSAGQWIENGKINLTQFAKDESLVDIILKNKYGTPATELKKIPFQKKIDTLFRIAVDDFKSGDLNIGLSASPRGGSKEILKAEDKVLNKASGLPSEGLQAQPLQKKNIASKIISSNLGESRA